MLLHLYDCCDGKTKVPLAIGVLDLDALEHCVMSRYPPRGGAETSGRLAPSHVFSYGWQISPRSSKYNTQISLVFLMKIGYLGFVYKSACSSKSPLKQLW